jgi:hypothetical protein
LDVFNGEAEGEQAGVFNLQAIVEQGDEDGSARLSVVAVNNRVHDRFADCYDWKRPKIGSLHGSDDRFASHVFPQERNHFLGGSGKMSPYLRRIQYPAAVAAREPSGLDPSVREMF